MRPDRQSPPLARPAMPAVLSTWLSAPRPCFTAPVWTRVLLLVARTVLSPGGRTETQALPVIGLAREPGFRLYHDVLSRARWDARDVARRPLGRLRRDDGSQGGPGEGVFAFVDEPLEGDLHSKRVLSLANATLGVMASASLAVAVVGRSLAQARGLSTRHAIKQVDRLLKNQT